MQRSTSPANRGVTQLPDTAPRVRLTAGVGTAIQKTWQLRRPVTLIGSRRPAHIVLHNQAASMAHCVIINTGTSVIIKDLHSTEGTLLNGTRTDVATPLQDGDALTIGPTVLHIGIEPPESTAPQEQLPAGQASDTMIVQIDKTDASWNLDEAAVVIGRHPAAEVRLNHHNVSTRHAVLYRWMNEIAVFDTGSRHGVWVEGERCTSAVLTHDTRLLIGPYIIVVRSSGLDTAKREACGDADQVLTNPETRKDSQDRVAAVPQLDGETPTEIWQLAKTFGSARQRPNRSLDEWSSLLDGLRNSADHAWRRVHSLSPSSEPATAASERNEGDARRAPWNSATDPTLVPSEVTANTSVTRDDARISGDVGSAALDHCASIETELTRRETDLARRESDLRRREHLLTRRWTASNAMTCPHCGRPSDAPPDLGQDQSLS